MQSVSNICSCSMVFDLDPYLTIPISFMEMAFGEKPHQLYVVDEAGIIYAVDFRCRLSRPREWYHGKGWCKFASDHMIRCGSLIHLVVSSLQNTMIYCNVLSL
ncbi:uncharacterized protein DS421_11g332200 [Arachis hypogaea]|nr:uncharacterized protein DS421_11g332200 [Arachis hypogaea]